MNDKTSCMTFLTRCRKTSVDISTVDHFFQLANFKAISPKLNIPHSYSLSFVKFVYRKIISASKQLSIDNLSIFYINIEVWKYCYTIVNCVDQFRRYQFAESVSFVRANSIDDFPCVAGASFFIESGELHSK